MCGGTYKHWETPRQLTKIYGEEIVARTIRLLKECGVKDIAISSNNPLFEGFGVPVLKHNNPFVVNENFKTIEGDWFYALYPTNEPTCYLFGDVVFSPEAIKTIVETEVDDIQLFASAKPFAENYIKPHEEPFALKVMKPEHLKEAIEKARELNKENKFWRQPMVWELFTVIKNAPLQVKRNQYTTDYFVINDYTCDIDRKEDINKILLQIGGIKMIKCEVIKEFTLGKFDELKNIERRGLDQKGRLFVGDIFECEKAMANYLMGENASNEVVVKVVEVVPEERIIGTKKGDEENIIPLATENFDKLKEQIEIFIEKKPKAKKTTKKKTSKK